MLIFHKVSQSENLILPGAHHSALHRTVCLRMRIRISSTVILSIEVFKARKYSCWLAWRVSSIRTMSISIEAITRIMPWILGKDQIDLTLTVTHTSQDHFFSPGMGSWKRSCTNTNHILLVSSVFGRTSTVGCRWQVWSTITSLSPMVELVISQIWRKSVRSPGKRWARCERWHPLVVKLVAFLLTSTSPCSVQASSYPAIVMINFTWIAFPRMFCSSGDKYLIYSGVIRKPPMAVSRILIGVVAVIGDRMWHEES